MDISNKDLVDEYRRALKTWPFLHALEKKYNLPPYLLFAIGSRETNLTLENGDGGHGHGVFQLDDRFHKKDWAEFDKNVPEQAETAAQMLRTLLAFWHTDPAPVPGYTNWLKAAVASYNTGTGGAKSGIKDFKDPDAYTAHGDYAADVLGRRWFLVQTFGVTPIPNPPVPTPHKKKVFYRVRQGDNLTLIAAKYGMSWQKLYRANRSTIGSNPNLIFVGEWLVIPGRFI